MMMMSKFVSAIQSSRCAEYLSRYAAHSRSKTGVAWFAYVAGIHDFEPM